MSVGIQISAVRDTATPALQRMAAAVQPGRLQAIIGRSAANTYKQHLLGLNQTRANALGGPRTNFYAAAARGTSFRVVGDDVVVSISSVGIRQRYFGGTIKPKTTKYLTIPAIPEAHGKRASEFQGLRFAIVPDEQGRQRPALVQGAQTLIRGRRSKGGVRFRAIGEIRERVVFWLARSVTQQPDPTVLPYTELVETRVQRDVAAYLQLQIDRAGGAS